MSNLATSQQREIFLALHDKNRELLRGNLKLISTVLSFATLTVPLYLWDEYLVWGFSMSLYLDGGEIEPQVKESCLAVIEGNSLASYEVSEFSELEEVCLLLLMRPTPRTIILLNTVIAVLGTALFSRPFLFVAERLYGFGGEAPFKLAATTEEAEVLITKAEEQQSGLMIFGRMVALNSNATLFLSLAILGASIFVELPADVVELAALMLVIQIASPIAHDWINPALSTAYAAFFPSVQYEREEGNQAVGVLGATRN